MVAAAPRHAPPPLRLVEWRCPKCGRLLGRVALSAGSVIEVKCDKCGAIVERRGGS